MNVHSPTIEPPSMLTGKGRVLLTNARIPAALLLEGAPQEAESDRDGSALVNLLIEDGKVLEVEPAQRLEDRADGQTFDVAGRHLWPLLIDVHTHLDKGHMVDRAPDSGGTHAGARAATTADRLAHWSFEDLTRRMEFGLQTAWAHGVGAIRTHLDSHEEQAETSWKAYSDLRRQWQSRIELQAVALVPLDVYASDHAKRLADIVVASGGLLGGVTRASGGTHGSGLDDLDSLLDGMFTLARERDLDVDLHVDEASVGDSLPSIARAAIRHGYEGRVTCGHCCSLALLSDAEIKERIALIADAGINIVTLPTVNMYLQDRSSGRTPRWRGVTPAKELRAAGVRVAVAGDNCRDTFYAYGDHDMLDTWRQGVKILHLDHPFGDAPALAASAPAGIMGIEAGLLGAGRPADFMIMEAWTMDHVLARPQSDRTIIRKGALANAPMPSYRQLEGI
jgi:cytosine/creatinine deaminase